MRLWRCDADLEGGVLILTRNWPVRMCESVGVDKTAYIECRYFPDLHTCARLSRRQRDLRQDICRVP